MKYPFLIYVCKYIAYMWFVCCLLFIRAWCIASMLLIHFFLSRFYSFTREREKNLYGFFIRQIIVYSHMLQYIWKITSISITRLVTHEAAWNKYQTQSMVKDKKRTKHTELNVLKLMLTDRNQAKNYLVGRLFCFFFLAPNSKSAQQKRQHKNHKIVHTISI